MDQAVIALSEENSATLISCFPRIQAESIPLPSKSVVFAVAHTLVDSPKASHAATHFNKRVFECLLASLLLLRQVSRRLQLFLPSFLPFLSALEVASQSALVVAEVAGSVGCLSRDTGAQVFISSSYQILQTELSRPALPRRSPCYLSKSPLCSCTCLSYTSVSLSPAVCGGCTSVCLSVSSCMYTVDRRVEVSFIYCMGVDICRR